MSLREMASFGIFNTASAITGINIPDIVETVRGLGITDRISNRYNDYREQNNRDNNEINNNIENNITIPNVEHTYNINSNRTSNNNISNSNAISSTFVNSNGSFVTEDIRENNYSSKLKSNVANYQQMRESLNTTDLNNLDIMRNYMISINSDLDEMLKGLNNINADKYAPLYELVDKLEELERINEDILDLNKEVSKEEVEQFFKLQKEISEILDDNEKEFKNDDEYLRYLRKFKEYTGKDLHNFADLQERFEDYAEENNASDKELEEWSKKNYNILSSTPVYEEMKNITGQLGLGGDLGALMEAFGFDPLEMVGNLFNKDKDNTDNTNNTEFDDFAVFDDNLNNMSNGIQDINENIASLNDGLTNPNEIVKRQKIINNLSKKIKSNENDLKDLQEDEVETALKNLDLLESVDSYLYDISEDLNNMRADDFSQRIEDENFYNDIVEEIRTMRENTAEDLLKANSTLADIEENTEEALENDIFGMIIQAIMSKFMSSNSFLPDVDIDSDNDRKKGKNKGGSKKGFFNKVMDKGKDLAKGGIKKAGVIGTVAGIGLTAHDNYTDPNLTTEEATKKTIIEGGAATAGAAIGGALGTLIPIPGVGTFLGASVGGWIGAKAGEYFTKDIGKDANEELTDLNTANSYQNEEVYDFNEVDTNSLKYEDYNRNSNSGSSSSPNININSNLSNTGSYSSPILNSVDTEDLMLSVLARG